MQDPLPKIGRKVPCMTDSSDFKCIHILTIIVHKQESGKVDFFSETTTLADYLTKAVFTFC